MTVVDTNVPVVANVAAPQASQKCVKTCIERLLRINNDAEKLALDDRWQIIKEYQRYLNPDGQPGVGDAFLKWVLTNYRNPQRCELVSIHADVEREFEEFPTDPDLQGFDISDRKFVAVAVAHRLRPPILQAVDAGWWNFRIALERNGVIVDFLCQDDVQRILA